MSTTPIALQRDNRTWIWTDGSYHSLSAVGGWAWCRPDGTAASGAIGEGVSSEYMELMAIREALEAHQATPGKLHDGLLIFCDHQGIVRKLNEARTNPRGFKLWATGSRRNPDVLSLLVGIEILLRDTPTEFRWTKGHHRDHHNKVVDRLSRQARWKRENTLPEASSFTERKRLRAV